VPFVLGDRTPLSPPLAPPSFGPFPLPMGIAPGPLEPPPLSPPLVCSRSWTDRCSREGFVLMPRSESFCFLSRSVLARYDHFDYACMGVSSLFFLGIREFGSLPDGTCRLLPCFFPTAFPLLLVFSATDDCWAPRSTRYVLPSGVVLDLLSLVLLLDQAG